MAYRISVVCPGRPFHGAYLYVEWEVLDGYGAGRSVDPVREPSHLAPPVHDDISVDHCVAVSRISTEKIRSCVEKMFHGWLSDFEFFFTACHLFQPPCLDLSFKSKLENYVTL